MRTDVSRTPVSSKPQTIAASQDGAFRFVCGALALATGLLILRILGCV